MRSPSDRTAVDRCLAGGGIVPDVLLEPDTLTTAEQRFSEALDGKLAAFRDVLNAYALDLRRSGTISSEAFVVNPSMRVEIRRRLEARGVRMADSLYAGGGKIVDQQLGYEVARYAFGPSAERRRRVSDDPQIGQAVALVRQAATPGALLGLAGGATRPRH